MIDHLISNHLVFIRRLQVVIKHLKMKHRRYVSTNRRHNPNPISWTSAAKFVLVFIVFHERFRCGVMIENCHVRFLLDIIVIIEKLNQNSNKLDKHLVGVQNCVVQFDKRLVFPQ